MTHRVFVLCYHRVLPDDDRKEHRPYFMRGTAVRLSVFRRHMRDVRERFEVLDEDGAIAVLEGQKVLSRPACWVTFDDGYADVLEHAVPAMTRFGIVGSLFLTTGVLRGASLPVDRWYTALTTARRSRSVWPIGEPLAFDLGSRESWKRLVNGPEKRGFVLATPSSQNEVLRVLSEMFDATSTEPQATLYLSGADVIELRGHGWSIGSHGVTHTLLPSLAASERVEELRMSRSDIEVLLGEPPRVFAYPDGASDEVVATEVRHAGYEAALALEPRPADPSCFRWCVPRFLARDDPTWVEALCDQDACHA